MRRSNLRGLDLAKQWLLTYISRMDIISYAAPLAIICAIYAVLTGLSWLRRLIGERAAKRGGMVLNLLRRVIPPALAGVLLLIAGRFMTLPDHGAIAALLILGALAYGLHRGLLDLGRPNWREHGLRASLTAAFSLFVFWQVGIF